MSGIGFLLVSALCWSLYYHFSEKLREYALLTRIFWFFLIHIPMLFIFFGLPEPGEIMAMTVNSWVCVFVLAFVASLGGYFFTQKSIKIINPVATATLNYLEPMAAVILAIVFLSEGMSFIQVIGWGLILFTLINIRKLKRPEKA